MVKTSLFSVATDLSAAASGLYVVPHFARKDVELALCGHFGLSPTACGELTCV